MASGEKSNLSKKTERDLRYRTNKKVRIFMHNELPLLKERGFAAALYNDAAVINSGGLGHCSCCTVRSSIAAAKVAPNQTNSKPNELQVYEKRMLRPGFEPGISDSKGRYA
jgi:hypothetical protein